MHCQGLPVDNCCIFVTAPVPSPRENHTKSNTFFPIASCLVANVSLQEAFCPHLPAHYKTVGKSTFLHAPELMALCMAFPEYIFTSFKLNQLMVTHL